VIYLRASFKRKCFSRCYGLLTGGRRVICALAPGSVEDLISVRSLSAGKIKSVIDKSFHGCDPHRYMEEEQERQCCHNNETVTVSFYPGLISLLFSEGDMAYYF
jgi:hypothetical protein